MELQIEEYSMEGTMGVLLRGGCACDAVRFEITDVFDSWPSEEETTAQQNAAVG